MYSLLTDDLIRVRLIGGQQVRLSLPELYERLAADDVESFPALRPHQRHPWHALLCQLGAVACLRSGLPAPPGDAPGWAAILTALTPDYPAGEPWQLVAPPDKPAFLQAPVGSKGVAELTTQWLTPDSADALILSRNHDLKREGNSFARPMIGCSHWWQSRRRTARLPPGRQPATYPFRA